MLEEHFEKKAREATHVIIDCIGKDGFWADATRDGYKDVYFTRDLAISVDGIIDAQRGLENLVKVHLENLAARQQPSGSIDVWFKTDQKAWYKQKLRRAVIDGEWRSMLVKLTRKVAKKYDLDFLMPQGVSHDTTDSELQFIDAVWKYSKLTGDSRFINSLTSKIERAFEFAQKRIDHDGLYTGVDWRDNVRFPLNVRLLSNNALLYHVYQILGMTKEAEALKEKIQRYFWNGSFHIDYLGSNNFDAHGQALVVQYGIADHPKQYPSIAMKFNSLRTPTGLKANNLVSPQI